MHDVLHDEGHDNRANTKIDEASRFDCGPDILLQDSNTFPYVTIFLLRQIVVQSVGTKAKKTIVDHMINPKVGVHLYFYKFF